MSTMHGFTRIGERLRHYTPALADLSRTLFDTRGELAESCPPLRAVCTGAAPPARAASVRIGGANGELRLLVDMARHPALEAIVLEPHAAHRTALANLWFAGALEMLERHGVIKPTILELALNDRPNASPGADGALVIAYGCEDGCEIVTLVHASDTLAPILARHQTDANLQVSPMPPSLASLEIPTRLRLRSRRCSVAQLASLRPGDILLGWPRACAYAPGARLENASLLWGAPNGRSASAHARVDGRHAIVESYPQTMNHDNEPSLASPADSDNAHALDDVELPVHIELVTINLQLDQIAALQPGSILTLPMALNDAQIRLSAHGQTLAFGELVAVGDNLGLLIHHVAPSYDRRT